MSIPLDSNRRLQNYISYFGLPEDIGLFVSDGSEHTKCLFCRNPSADRPVLNKEGDHTGAFCCEFCNEEIKDSHQDNGGILKYQAKKLINSLNAETDFEIPADVKKYYIHLNGSQKDIFNNSADRCYICNQLPKVAMYESSAMFDPLEIPVRADKYLSGGKIRICDDHYCRTTRKNYIHCLNELKEFSKYSKQTDVVERICPTCTGTYHILGAANEIEYRVHMPESYEWQCPSCAYKMMETWERNPKFQAYYPEVIGDPRTDLIQRAYTKQCYYCNSATSIDLYQTEFSFVINHTIDSKIVCKNCSLQGNWFKLPTVYRLGQSNIYIELHYDMTFSAFRLRKGSQDTILMNCRTNAANMAELVFIAQDEVIEVLGGIRSLWELS